MNKKGVTQYKLNKRVELRAKKMVEMGFHNTVTDLIEYAVMKHVLELQKRYKEVKEWKLKAAKSKKMLKK